MVDTATFTVAGDVGGRSGGSCIVSGSSTSRFNELQRRLLLNRGDRAELKSEEKKVRYKSPQTK